MRTGFVKSPQGNYTLEADGFYISYRPPTPKEDDPVLAHPISLAMRVLMGVDGHNDEAGETAFCVRASFPTMINPYFVLNGDFRKDYEGLIAAGGKAKECWEFWLSQSEHNSIYSNNENPWETQAC